jgi:hypothetical protein
MARDVTTQTATGVLGRLSAKTENQILGSSDLLIIAGCRFNSLNMSLAGPMTAFASCAVCRFFWSRFGMNRFQERVCMDWMTTHAGFRADVIASLS